MKPVERPAVNPAIETAFLATEAVLYDERTGQTSVLNAAATAVWLVIDGERDVGEIVAEVAGDFGVDPESIGADVGAVLADFAARGLLDGPEVLAAAEQRYAVDEPRGGGPSVLPRPPDP